MCGNSGCLEGPIFSCVHWNISEPWCVVSKYLLKEWDENGLFAIVRKKIPDSIYVYATCPHAILCRQFVESYHIMYDM